MGLDRGVHESLPGQGWKGAGGAEDLMLYVLPQAGSQHGNTLKCWHLVAAWENSIYSKAKPAL